jgi:hypothetical protein
MATAERLVEGGVGGEGGFEVVEGVDGVEEVGAFDRVDAAVACADFEVAGEDGAFGGGDERGKFSGAGGEKGLCVGEMPGLGSEKVFDFKLVVKGKRSGSGLGRVLVKRGCV